jgi:chromo domain-containing protein 1
VTSYLDSGDDVPQPTSTLDSLSGSNNIAAGTTPSEQTAGIKNWNTPSTHEAPIARNVDPGPTSLSCLRFQEIVEDACKLNFAEMFGDENGSTMLRQIAFLMFHPKNHAKELELITRWLHLHYVEVRNVWLEGSWSDFKQQVVGGSTGVIIVSLMSSRFVII